MKTGLQKSDESEKAKDGLPEIAEQFRKKKSLVIAIIAVIAIISMFFSGKHNKKVSQPVEETYSVQQSIPQEIKTQLPTQQSTVSSNQVDQAKLAMAQEQLAMIKQKQNELQQRLAAPLMLVNTSTQSSKVDSATQTNSQTTGDRDTQFLNQVSSQNVATVTATKIGPLNYIIGEGTLIHAILESATNSDLPGSVRAIVDEPCYSEDGTQILIPKGSRLLGQYKSGMLQGQSRIFMVWTRLLTPSGISIQIGSPGVDSLGAAGMGADEIDRHFWARFGTASLLSVIGAGAANVGVSGADQDNSASTYRTAMANSFSKSADDSLDQDGRIPPTLTTYQGKPIMVFVAKDLNFQDAMKQANSSLNIF